MSSKSQRFLDCFTANMKVLRWFETSLTSKPHSAPHDMPVYLTLQPYRCENLKYSSVFITLFRLMITWDWVPWNCGHQGDYGAIPSEWECSTDGMTTAWWKSRSKGASPRKSCLTCHSSNNRSPMDCSGIEGGPPRWKCTPESPWCSPIRNYNNFWSTCTVLSADMGRWGVGDVSTKFISGVTLDDPSFISHRASGPVALCRPISWESAVPFFIAITRRTSGFRISCVLFWTAASRTPALSCHIMDRIKPNEENLGSHRADKNTVFSNMTSCGRVEIYIRFEGTCCLHLQDKFESEDGVCRHIRNLG